MSIEFAAVDTETTGLDSETDQVIDISIILLDGDLNQVDELNVFALPEPHVIVSPGAAKANGYTPEKWASLNAVTQAEMARQVYEFVYKYSGLKLIAHNVPFDQGFLKKLFERHAVTRGGEAKAFSRTFGYHHIDTIPISLFMDFATQGVFRRSYSLANLTKDFGIAHDAAHTAKSDIKACLDLLRHHKKIVEGLVPTAAVTLSQSRNGFSKIITQVSKDPDVWVFAQGKNSGKTVVETLREDATYVLHVLGFKDLSPEQRQYLQSSYQAHIGI